MAVMNATERARTAIAILRLYADLFWGNLGKSDITGAIAAIDDWVDSNTATINNQFPANFKATATASQKAMIVAAVALRRAGKLKVQEDG